MSTGKFLLRQAPRLHADTVLTSRRATCNPLSGGKHVHRSLDFFILSWSNRLKEAEAERDWLCANATRLASIHSVSPEDLVLCELRIMLENQDVRYNDPIQ